MKEEVQRTPNAHSECDESLQCPRFMRWRMKAYQKVTETKTWRPILVVNVASHVELY